jgi:hypothetical protein
VIARPSNAHAPEAYPCSRGPTFFAHMAQISRQTELNVRGKRESRAIPTMHMIAVDGVNRAIS